MLELARIQALCFDVDGTLSDTDDAWAARFAQVLGKFSGGRDVKPLARQIVMEIESPGNWAYSLLDRMGLDHQVAWLFSQYTRITRHGGGKKHFWIIPHTRETLELLAKRYPMAVVSARGAKGTQAFLEQYELQGYFKTVVTAQTCRYTKPFPDPIRYAAAQMGVAPEACLMIGDTTVDIRAGKAAGAQTVGVLCGFGSERELRRAGADLILPSPAELVDVLEKKSPIS